ncbi:unnamed protein product [Cylindrotheca closterium]|uniref:Uncharacterized protein n=1 Tax=Cylindrotheca closterium TaxID=2856 RepID=A0AAD2GF92_9STRA|nr:unnamed protein product [Cylindrotheca closterium]
MARTRRQARRRWRPQQYASSDDEAQDSFRAEEEVQENDSDLGERGDADEDQDPQDDPDDGDDPDENEDPDDSGDDDSNEEDTDDEKEETDGEAPGSLTPGLASMGRILRYEKKSDKSIFNKATSKLDDEGFDCTSDQFLQIMKALEHRGNNFGWNDTGGLFWVLTPGRQPVNLLHSYGSVSLPRIQRYERTYWDSGNRKSQDDRMLYECIMNSLTRDAKSKLNIHWEDFQLGPNKLPSGLCLLKTFIREAYLDSNATTGMIREQLSTLDAFIPTVDHDINRFNNHVKMLLMALHARGEKTLDLLTYLFRAYNACKDENFVKYIGDLQTDHDMGTKAIDSRTLMSLAEKKYRIMVTTKTWEAPSAAQEEILAMQTRLNKLSDKLAAKTKDGKQRKRKELGADNGSPKKKVKFEKGKGKKQMKEKPDWMSKPPPKTELNRPRSWNNKQWHYCCKETGGNCGGVWRVHLPKNCKSKPKHDDEKEPAIVAKEAIDDLVGGYYSE